MKSLYCKKKCILLALGKLQNKQFFIQFYTVVFSCTRIFWIEKTNKRRRINSKIRINNIPKAQFFISTLLHNVAISIFFLFFNAKKLCVCLIYNHFFLMLAHAHPCIQTIISILYFSENLQLHQPFPIFYWQSILFILLNCAFHPSPTSQIWVRAYLLIWFFF